MQDCNNKDHLQCIDLNQHFSFLLFGRIQIKLYWQPSKYMAQYFYMKLHVGRAQLVNDIKGFDRMSHTYERVV